MATYTEVAKRLDRAAALLKASASAYRHGRFATAQQKHAEAIAILILERA